jgi:cytochrome o ubiquinol oxidase subunit 3
MSVQSLTSVHGSAVAAGHDHHAHDDHHDAGDKTVFGFWLYLMTDCILFAGIFATYAVLNHATAGGPTGKELFELPYVLVETFCLLVSSLTYGLAMLAMARGNRNQLLGWLAITFVLGAAFIGMELNEFHNLIVEGATPQRSAFLSAFFTLVGTHGLHVTSGLIWMIVLAVQVMRRGLTPTNQTRLMCLSLFWHFLDIIWIGVFTVVYLLGVV